MLSNDYRKSETNNNKNKGTLGAYRDRTMMTKKIKITGYIAEGWRLNLQLTDKKLLKARGFYVINSRIFKQETVNYCLHSLSVRKYARAILSV